VNVDHVRVPSNCIGCVTAADVDMVEHGAYVVHVHPACPVHSELVQLRAEVRRLRSGATGQCKVTEEWTHLPGTNVEIRLRPPMRSGYVGYRTEVGS
jgi:hypothetical protein